jgi:hypothetical protein
MPAPPNPADLASGLPRELRLLLRCVRWPLIEQDGERLRLALEATTAQPFDWMYFLSLCEHHRVTPIVYRTLGRVAECALARVPGEVMAALKTAATRNAHSTLRSLAETERVSALLRGAGIAARVLKGVPLSQQIFRDPALRQVGDIDLLIAPGMEEAADRLLLADVYYRNDPAARLTPRRRLSWRTHGKDYTYRSHSSPFELDLHWRLFRNPHMPGNRLAEPVPEASERMMLGNTEVAVLPPQRGFLFLCVHGALDGWFRFKSLVDVAAWWRSFDAQHRLDVTALGREHQVLPELAAALHLAGGLELLDSEEIPVALQLQAAAREARWIADYAQMQHASQHYRPTQDGAGTVALKRYEFGLRRGLRYRLAILRRVLLRPRVWTRFDLPDVLFPLYALLSPVEWVIFHRMVAQAAGERGNRSRWHRLRALPRPRRWMLAEAFAALLAARAALLLLPGRWIFRWIESPAHARTPGQSTTESVRWAVLSVARYSPLRFVCFPQALAAHAMLRRRGVASVMHYGVRRSADGQLRAHTWLEVDGRMLLGGESAPLFARVRSSSSAPPADMPQS